MAANDVSTTFKPEFYALDTLLQLNETLPNFLPNYLSIDDNLKKLIDAAQKALDVSVTVTNSVQIFCFKSHINT